MKLALPIAPLPPGVKQLAPRDAEVMDELSASFGPAMLTGIWCINIVLLLFKDFLHPFAMLAALLRSSGGAFVAHLWRAAGCRSFGIKLAASAYRISTSSYCF